MEILQNGKYTYLYDSIDLKKIKYDIINYVPDKKLNINYKNFKKVLINDNYMPNSILNLKNTILKIELHVDSLADKDMLLGDKGKSEINIFTIKDILYGKIKPNKNSILIYKPVLIMELKYMLTQIFYYCIKYKNVDIYAYLYIFTKQLISTIIDNINENAIRNFSLEQEKSKLNVAELFKLSDKYRIINKIKNLINENLDGMLYIHKYNIKHCLHSTCVILYENNYKGVPMNKYIHFELVIKHLYRYKNTLFFDNMIHIIKQEYELFLEDILLYFVSKGSQNITSKLKSLGCIISISILKPCMTSNIYIDADYSRCIHNKHNKNLSNNYFINTRNYIMFAYYMYLRKYKDLCRSYDNNVYFYSNIPFFNNCKDDITINSKDTIFITNINIIHKLFSIKSKTQINLLLSIIDDNLLNTNDNDISCIIYLLLLHSIISKSKIHIKIIIDHVIEKYTNYIIDFILYISENIFIVHSNKYIQPNRYINDIINSDSNILCDRCIYNAKKFCSPNNTKTFNNYDFIINNTFYTNKYYLYFINYINNSTNKKLLDFIYNINNLPDKYYKKCQNNYYSINYSSDRYYNDYETRICKNIYYQILLGNNFTDDNYSQINNILLNFFSKSNIINTENYSIIAKKLSMIQYTLDQKKEYN